VATVQRRFGGRAEIANHFPDGYYQSTDGKTLIVAAHAAVSAGDLPGSKEVLRRVTAAVDELRTAPEFAAVRVGYTGDLKTSLTEYGAVRDDLVQVGALGLGLVVSAGWDLMIGDGAAWRELAESQRQRRLHGRSLQDFAGVAVGIDVAEAVGREQGRHRRLARGHAALDARDYVIPEDVKAVAIAALAHRLVLRPEMWVRRVTGEDLITEILTAEPVPRASR